MDWWWYQGLAISQAFHLFISKAMPPYFWIDLPNLNGRKIENTFFPVSYWVSYGPADVGICMWGQQHFSISSKHSFLFYWVFLETKVWLFFLVSKNWWQRKRTNKSAKATLGTHIFITKGPKKQIWATKTGASQRFYRLKGNWEVCKETWRVFSLERPRFYRLNSTAARLY